MSKNLVSIIVFAILLVFFIHGFSDSYSSHNLSNLAYVLAIGIDVGENAPVKVSLQFSRSSVYSPSNSSSSDASNEGVIVSGEAESLYSALNLINTYIGKELNFAHCSIAVFSNEYAQNGISSEIYSLMNNEEVRPSVNMIVSNCSAYDYLYNVKPNLEKLNIHYYDTFSITNKFTGFLPNVTIGDFFNSLSSDTNNGIAILGGLDLTARSENSESSENSSNGDSSSDSSSSASEPPDINEEELQDSNIEFEDLTAGSSTIEGDRGTENIGIAVFKGDKLCGELSAIETMCHLLIQNKIDNSTISVEDPIDSSGKVEIGIYPKKDSNIIIEIKDNIPYINVSLYLDADIITLSDNVDYESEEVIDMFSTATKEYLEDQFENYFNKISKEYNSDIDSFAYKALSIFETSTVWEEFNWSEKFKNAEFNIDININVLSSILITKT